MPRSWQPKQQAAQQLAADTAPQAGLRLPRWMRSALLPRAAHGRNRHCGLKRFGFIMRPAQRRRTCRARRLREGDLVAYQAAKQRGASDKAKQDAKASAPSAADKKAQQHQANIDKVGAQSSLGQSLHGALLEFASPDEAITLAPQNVQPLVTRA